MTIFKSIVLKLKLLGLLEKLLQKIKIQYYAFFYKFKKKIIDFYKTFIFFLRIDLFDQP